MVGWIWHKLITCQRKTVDSRYLEIEGTIINTLRYPYFDISDLWYSGNIIWTTKFYKWLCNVTPLIRNIYWKYCGKGEKLLPQEQFLLFSTIFCNLIFDFYVKTRTRFSLRDKQLFEVTKVEITRVDCIEEQKFTICQVFLFFDTFIGWFKHSLFHNITINTCIYIAWEQAYRVLILGYKCILTPLGIGFNVCNFVDFPYTLSLKYMLLY